MQSKIFICHSTKDHEFVKQLVDRLEKDSIDVWFSEWEIKVGDSITQRVDKALEDSSFFVIVFSEASLNSNWVKRELNSTLMRQINRRDVKVLPVLLDLEPSRLPTLVTDILAAKFSKDKWDENEYKKLVQPIVEKRRGRILKEYQDRFFETVEHIDIILAKANPTKHEIGFTLRIIQEPQYSDYFFKNVGSFAWFDILQLRDYFSPSDALSPVKKKDNTYSIPMWNILPYLERVSERVEVPGNEQYVDRLLQIIRSVTEYRTEDGESLDNYRVWWYFVKVLLNLPASKIPTDVIDLIPNWLDSRFDASLPGSEIGTKLLPKFLNSEDRNDWKKAERILEILSSLRPQIPAEKESVPTQGEEVLETVLDSYWLLESVRQNVANIAEKCSTTIVFSIADRVKQIIRKKYSGVYGTAEFKGEVYQISVQQFDDFDYSLRVVLQKEVLEEKGVWKSLVSAEIKDCKDREAFVCAATQGFSESATFEDLGHEFDEELKELYDGAPRDLSTIWYRDLFSGPDLGSYEAEETLVTVLRDILLEKGKSQRKPMEKVLSELSGAKYRNPIFRRLVLFMVGSEWDSFKHFFWRLFALNDQYSLFDDYSIEPELYGLLEKNVARLTSDEKERIEYIIEKGSTKPLKDETQKSYWRQRWYSALKDDPQFAVLYEAQKELTQTEEEIGFREPSTKMGPGPTPLSKGDILRMSNDKLADYLGEYRTKDAWRGPTVSALSEAVKAAAQELPGKFVEDLRPFLEAPYFHVYNILAGLRDAWVSKKSFDWKKLFEFLECYIGRDAFWKDEFRIPDDGWGADHRWITGMGGELIQEGTRNDTWAFAKDNFAHATKVVALILDKEKPGQPTGPTDPVMLALNSVLGKAIIALILLSLRIARVRDKEGSQEKDKWPPKLKKRYEDVLADTVIEAYTLLGMYMPDLWYLDKKLVQERVELISYSEMTDLWEALMSGYLSISTIYKDLYGLMRNHCLSAIEHEFMDKRTGVRLVHYICAGYLKGFESMEENSLLGKLLLRWETSQVQEIIRFFWSLHKKSVEGYTQERIVHFWRYAYKKYVGMEILEEADKKILSNLCLLTAFLPEIDSENLQWLRMCARFAGVDFKSSYFIEYLDRLKDDKCRVGRIVLEMLTEYTPDYPRESIESIVKHLYEINVDACRKTADDICNIYGERGYDFLRPLYEEHGGERTE